MWRKHSQGRGRGKKSLGETTGVGGKMSARRRDVEGKEGEDEDGIFVNTGSVRGTVNQSEYKGEERAIAGMMRGSYEPPTSQISWSFRGRP